jgi:PAS domain S-box-containing protein
VGPAVGVATMNRDRPANDFAEELFRLAVEACPNGMLMTDSSGIIVLVNSETERLFGYRRSELIGQPVEILIPERMRKHHSGHRTRFSEHPKVRRIEASHNLVGLRRDGSEFPVEIGLNPIRTVDGLFVLNVVIDISDRHRVDCLKDEFVATVSHELRTPLTSIAGSLGLLLGGAAGKLPDGVLRFLGIAHSNCTRLVRLINDILDIEKIEAGSVVFSFKRIVLRQLAAQVVEANRGFADSFAVRVCLDPAADDGVVLADPDRLAQVITNLVSNAVKFSPRDGEVELTIGHRDGRMRIAVRDHGPGIPEDFRPRIFEKFAQAEATDARQKGGTGLGLSIARKIVTRLGGTIGFADAAGGGTEFFVELPDWAQIAAREIDAARRPDDTRILLCEDDPDAAMAVREGLRPFGFSTDFAHDVEDAIKRARGNGRAAIVVDFELPDAGGIALIRLLREQPEVYRTPIVIASAEPVPAKDGAAELNVLKWIAKPIDAFALTQVLDGAIARGANGRPCILHIEDDRDILDLVARALQPTVLVVSAGSIEEARAALLAHHFDLVVLDITLGEASGLDLLPDLRNRGGATIPVVIFSGESAEHAATPQVEARLTKINASLDDLVVAVHDRLMLRSASPRKEMA